MAQYVWLVLTNATAGDDEAFNRWYNDVHIPDLLRVPGVKSAQRFKATPRQMINVAGALAMADRTEGNAPHTYMAIYNIETDGDVEKVLLDILSRAGTPEMIISETLYMGDGTTPTGPKTLCYEALGPVAKK
jgi:hypothetical protein